MNQLTMEEIKFLNEKAKNIRIDILKSITKANSYPKDMVLRHCMLL